MVTSRNPLYKIVRQLYSADPETPLADISRQYNINRNTLAGWVSDYRKKIIKRRGKNKAAEIKKLANIRKCLKCHRAFELEQNYYRCGRCRAAD